MRYDGIRDLTEFGHHTLHIRNRCYNHRTDKTPYESCTGQKPDLSKLHVFGTVCYGYVQQTKKLDARAKQGIFVGYDKTSPAYLVYFPNSQTVKRIRCVNFTDRFNVNKPAQSSLHDDIGQPNVHCDWRRPNDPDRETGNVVNKDAESIPNDHATSDDENRRYPKRATTKPRRLDDYVTTAVIDNADCEVDYCYRLVMGVPVTFADGIASTEATEWQSAMEREMTSLRDNDVYTTIYMLDCV